jgi:hypothetical protein
LRAALPSCPLMLLHFVLALLGLGCHSAEAVSFNKKASLCNVACGQQGKWNMPAKGATAKPNKCYHCWATGYAQNCPDADYRDDGWTYDDCCNLYDCSCTTASPCTHNQVGDGSCQGNCNNAQCGYDNGDCSTGSSESAVPSPLPTHCPCCSQHTPTLAETTGAKVEEGFCWYCYATDYGGNCPDADERSDGWTYDDCCNRYAKTTRVCARRFSNAECIDHHGANTDGLLDATLDATAGLVDAAGNAVSAAFTAVNPLSDMEPIEPDCVLKLDNCGASCTFGFSSVKSSLLLEFVLELDVQSATRGTATFEASANGVTMIKDSHDFSDGDSDAYCVAIPGLGVSGLGGLFLCMNLDPDQTGGFTITSEVFMEIFIRISLLPVLGVFPDADFALGNDRVSWPCPNTPLIVGCIIGAIVLCGLLCFVGYRRRNARLKILRAESRIELASSSHRARIGGASSRI